MLGVAAFASLYQQTAINHSWFPESSGVVVDLHAMLPRSDPFSAIKAVFIRYGNAGCSIDAQSPVFALAENHLCKFRNKPRGTFVWLVGH